VMSRTSTWRSIRNGCLGLGLAAATVSWAATTEAHRTIEPMPVAVKSAPTGVPQYRLAIGPSPTNPIHERHCSPTARSHGLQARQILKTTR